MLVEHRVLRIEAGPPFSILDEVAHWIRHPWLSAVAEQITEFAAGLAVLPEPENDDEARTQAREIMAQLGAAGWFQPIAKQDFRACSLVREALAEASPLADAVFAIQALAATPILIGGNQDMQATWIAPTIAGEAMGGFAMTEAEAGSDVAAISTVAVPDGDAYILNGVKTLISNAGIADYYVLFASTDPDQGARGLSCFVVDADRPGLRFVGPLVMSAPHPLGEIELVDCRVPAACRLGEEGDGFKIGMATWPLRTDERLVRQSRRSRSAIPLVLMSGERTHRRRR